MADRRDLRAPIKSVAVFEIHKGALMPTARDIMTTDVIAFSPVDSAEVAIRSLVEYEISGAPVAEDGDRLVGIITEFQLMAAFYDNNLKAMKVKDAMTTDVFTVNADESLRSVADALIKLRVRRLPVVEGGRIVGIVSRRDLLRHVLSERD